MLNFECLLQIRLQINIADIILQEKHLKFNIQNL